MTLNNLSRKEIYELAKKIKRSGQNMYHISLGYKKMGVGLAKEINKADPRFKLSDLRPDIWGSNE